MNKTFSRKFDFVLGEHNLENFRSSWKKCQILRISKNTLNILNNYYKFLQTKCM